VIRVRQLRRFLGLPWRDQLLLARAGSTVLCTRLVLGLVPFRVGRRMLRPRPTRHPANIDRDKLAWAVLASSHAVPGGRNCLVRAMALERMLRKRGLDAELHLGARGPADAFAAHAWIQRDGGVLIGGDDQDTYELLTKLPD